MAARWRKRWGEGEEDQEMEVRCCIKGKKVSKVEVELILGVNTRIRLIFVDVVRRHSRYYL